MSNQSEGLRQATAKIFELWRASLAQVARRFGLGPTDAERLAAAALGAVQGAIVIARSTRSAQPFADAATAIKALAASMPAGAPPTTT